MIHQRFLLFDFYVVLNLIESCSAFTQAAKHGCTGSTLHSRTSLTSFFVSTTDTLVQDLDRAIKHERTADEPSGTLTEHLNNMFSRLEARNPTEEPCRSPSCLGEWHIWFTNAPPPSNGQLGPFRGAVSQVLYEDGTYENRLSVAPNGWLTSTLDGLWEEWDGVFLDASSDQSESKATPRTKDWGSSHTKVTFRSVEICVLGLRLFRMKFPSDTCRIWRTTYLDNEIRLLRAGRTGRQEDESVFYTKRKKVCLDR